MIGIDFTWSNFREDPTSSLAVFTCDLLDCIAEQNQQKNFVIIAHPLEEKCFGSVFQHFRFMVLVVLA